MSYEIPRERGGGSRLSAPSILDGGVARLALGVEGLTGLENRAAFVSKKQNGQPGQGHHALIHPMLLLASLFLYERSSSPGSMVM